MTTRHLPDDDPRSEALRFGAPVHADTTLRDTWHQMVAPLGFGANELWVMLLQDDCLTQVVIRIDDRPEQVDHAAIANLMTMAVELDLPGLSMAFLVIRPGAGIPTALDQQWSQTIESCAAEAGVCVRRTHLATDEDVLTLR